MYLVDVDTCQDDNELVATETGYDIAFPNGSSQTPRYFQQQDIANVVAQRVVHVLEAVQVEEHHGHPLPALTARRDQCLFETPLQVEAIRQVGEGIVVRQMADLLFRLLALGNVHEAAEVVFDLALAVLDRRDRQPLRVAAAILAPIPDLALPMSALL